MNREMNRQTTAISEIVIGKRFRKFSKAAMQAIAESLDEPQRDLVNPITLYQTDGRLHLCAGLHRLRAFEAKGETVIPYALMPSGEGIDYEIAELRENLARTELTGLERERHTSALLKRVTERAKKRSAADNGKLGGAKKAANANGLAAESSAAASEKEANTVRLEVAKLAKTTGKCERQVWKDKKRGDVMDALEEAGAPMEEAKEALEDNCTRKSLVIVADADKAKAKELVQRMADGDETASTEVKETAKQIKRDKIAKCVKTLAPALCEVATEAELKRSEKLAECRNMLRLIREDLHLLSDDALKSVYSTVFGLYVITSRAKSAS